MLDAVAVFPGEVGVVAGGAGGTAPSTHERRVWAVSPLSQQNDDEPHKGLRPAGQPRATGQTPEGQDFLTRRISPPTERRPARLVIRRSLVTYGRIGLREDVRWDRPHLT